MRPYRKRMNGPSKLLRFLLLFVVSAVIQIPSEKEGSAQSAPQEDSNTVVFESGKEGYRNFRIPAIVRTKAGTLLAFCEGRTGGDSGPIDLVLKRSFDNGKTWSPLQILWDDGENTCGNPCPVVDESTGTIWLLMTWNLGSDREKEIMEGKSQDVRHVYVTNSKDDGVTWANPTNISESTRQLDWRWYATGPGNGIQLTRGPNAGRLLIPANHSDHDEGGHPYRSHVFYSDDHGESWKLGGIHQDKTNESAVVELADGSILQAMRSYHGKNLRAMSVSKDGGENWGEVYLDPALTTPVCQASIIRLNWPDESGSNLGRILFSSPLGTERKKMTIWMSEDEGKSWPKQRTIYEGAAGYSNLVKLDEKSVGLLYERDNSRTISFVHFGLEWLEGKE